MAPDFEITKRKFEALPWHDAKLHRVELSSDCERALTLHVTFPVGERRQALVAFRDCQFHRTDVDVGWLTTATNDISSGRCNAESAWKSQLSESKRLKREGSSLGIYSHFSISLIPPGGEIEVLAESFELTWLDQGDARDVRFV